MKNNKYNDINEPPASIDGAMVLKWAWSNDMPFGFVESKDGSIKIPVHGIAICCYKNANEFYHFVCNKNWEVMQDSVYTSIVEATNQISKRYEHIEINWHCK